MRSPIEVPNTPRLGLGHDLIKQRLYYCRGPVQIASNLMTITKTGAFGTEVIDSFSVNAMLKD